MTDTTNNFIQHYPQSDTAEHLGLETKNEEESHFVEPKINYPDTERGVVYQEPDEIPELTQAQWRKYYRKMGLQ